MAWTDYIDHDVLARTAMRIGNYMLIDRQHAASLPRDPEERISRLTSLDLFAVSGSGVSTWSASKVSERQRLLASTALTTWPRTVHDQ